jgi:hypothetical protein
MHSANKKEQFNVAYVCAMAAQAGLNHSQLEVDDDSVDLILKGKGYTGKVRNPQIHLQLKCTSQDLISGNVIKFPLPKKNYDDLRGTNVVCPQYLVVLVVPKDENDWIQHHPEHMSLHNRCYWVSIKDKPERKSRTKVTIDIPLTQRLTTNDLRHLMSQASNGISL